MASNGKLDLDYLVQPDRVHRFCYTDADIFARELEALFEHTWIYVGHESQVKQPGDYATTQLGRQPVIMVRDTDGAIRVLYNRCPHRGSMMCNELMGNAGQTFTCSYHAWQFNLDGSVYAIPAKQGYDNTRFCMEDPDASMKSAARVESYRGFVFARLSDGGPELLDFLGGARMAFDDMCDRAPEGEVDIVPTCFRVIQKSNWKIFLENQLDALHPQQF